jgi:hypothetical protein
MPDNSFAQIVVQPCCLSWPVDSRLEEAGLCVSRSASSAAQSSAYSLGLPLGATGALILVLYGVVRDPSASARRSS